ncbi:DUF4349 domain-containing protein [Streptomyces sp. NPDC002044]|uniref:DUF4349 domain-containing protein n=1 Tax=Streptomyces sp. NPDC002044 TaxID=3154662 RepID=UPI003326E4DA
MRGHRSAAALTALSLAGALALTGCGAGSSEDKSAARPAAADRAPAAGPQDGAAQEGGAAAAKPGAGSAAPSAADAKAQPQPAPVRAHVIRTATLGIETAEPQKALAAARTEAERSGGYVGNESTGRGKDGRVTSTVTLRVPGERFDAVIGSLEGGGKLLNRKVETQDVGERVADVDSRVKSQQASVVRVREMMDRASALSDVVMLEGELSRRQSDLESLLAQQGALKDQTALGTITLSVSEPAPQAAEKKKEDEAGFADALRGGWDVFSTLVRYLVLAVGAVLPFAIAAALLALAFRVYRGLRPAKPRAAAAVARVPAQGAPGPWTTPAPPAGAPDAAPSRARASSPADSPAGSPTGNGTGTDGQG